jgi:hypothetical protein
MRLDSNAELFGAPSGSRPPGAFLSAERRFGQDVRHLLQVVCMAILNPSEFMDGFQDSLAYIAVYIPWDVGEYYSQCIKGNKDQSRMRFLNPDFGAFSEPLTVVDCKRRIVLWYLPGLLSQQQQVCFFLGPSFQINPGIQISWMFGMRQPALGRCLNSL